MNVYDCCKSFLVLSVCCLAACSPVALKKVKNPKLAWQVHQKKIRDLKCFTLSGLVGVSENGQGNSANIHWQQNNHIYHIELSGPLGVDASMLTNVGGFAELKTPKNTYKAQNAQTLLREQLGLNIPVVGLQNWVKGFPGEGKNFRLNDYGYLSELQDSGWRVRYISYQNAGGLGLPKQVILNRKSLRVVLSVYNWKKSC